MTEPILAADLSSLDVSHIEAPPNVAAALDTFMAQLQEGQIAYVLVLAPLDTAANAFRLTQRLVLDEASDGGIEGSLLELYGALHTRLASMSPAVRNAAAALDEQIKAAAKNQA